MFVEIHIRGAMDMGAEAHLFIDVTVDDPGLSFAQTLCDFRRRSIRWGRQCRGRSRRPGAGRCCSWFLFLARWEQAYAQPGGGVDGFAIKFGFAVGNSDRKAPFDDLLYIDLVAQQLALGLHFAGEFDLTDAQRAARSGQVEPAEDRSRASATGHPGPGSPA